MKSIEATDLTRTFNGLTAVDHITFDVHAGEIFGFLGPNGAGKTTTLRMLTGQLRPTSGRARVMGCDIVEEREDLKPQIGVVFEQQNLYTRFSADTRWPGAGAGRPYRPRSRADEQILERHAPAPDDRSSAAAPTACALPR
jgi:ABC-type branched-subunit amino acid transport system ATPase component